MTVTDDRMPVERDCNRPGKRNRKIVDQL